MVPIIVFFLFKKNIHWSVWPSVFLCVIGGYLLTNFNDATVRLGDTLVLLGAVFWSLHIIFIGIIIKEFDVPILIGLIQTIIVSFCSIILAFIFEDIILINILQTKKGIYNLIVQTPDGLYLVKDRFGVRPFFYGYKSDNIVICGSETVCSKDSIMFYEEVKPGEIIYIGENENIIPYKT